MAGPRRYLSCSLKPGELNGKKLDKLFAALRVNVEGKVKLPDNLHEPLNGTRSIARRAATDRFLRGIKIEFELCVVRSFETDAGVI